MREMISFSGMVRIGKISDLTQTKSKNTKVSLSLAVNRNYTVKNDGGEDEQRHQVQWYHGEAYGSVAEAMQRDVHKGDLLFIQGDMTTRVHRDDFDQERHSPLLMISRFGKIQLPERSEATDEPPEDSTDSEQN